MLLNNKQELRLEKAQSLLTIPGDYSLETVKDCTYNEQKATLYRFKKDDKDDKSSEHFSLLIQQKPWKLLGMMWLDKQFAKEQMLPREEVEHRARRFVERVDAELNAELNNLWIARHDETITIDGKQVTIPGMKYKCYRESNNDYSWVIVSHNGEIITFERDTKWRHNRQTEKRLHQELS